MQAQLDATLAQLQELKLQKLELEQKLQQRAQSNSLIGEVQSAVFVVLQKATHYMPMHLTTHVLSACHKQCGSTNAAACDTAED